MMQNMNGNDTNHANPGKRSEKQITRNMLAAHA